MKNPRAVYSRGIWQGGGATVLKPYDASGVFGKVLAQKAAQGKTQKAQKLTDEDILNLKGNWWTRNAEEINNDFTSWQDDYSKSIDPSTGSFKDIPTAVNFNIKKLNIENKLRASKENEKAYDIALSLLADKAGDKFLYPKEREELLANAEKFAQMPVYEAKENKDLVSVVGYEEKPDIKKTFYDGLNTVIKSDKMGGADYDANGNIAVSLTEKVTEEKATNWANAVTGVGSKFDRQLRRMWDKGGVSDEEKQAFGNDYETFKTQTIEDLKKPIPYERITGNIESGYRDWET